MRWRPNKFWYAVATLVGATVGIGFFGIPFTFAKAGLGFGLLFFAAVVGLILVGDLLYGEIILRTHERHQFVGYVQRYLGPWARFFALANFWIAMYGAFVAMLVINGEFSSQLLSFFHINISSVVTGLLFFAIAMVFVYRGLRTVSHIDFIMMFVFVGATVLIALLGARYISAGNYSFAVTEMWFLPFGVILYAMNGVNGIPLVREVLVGNENKYKRAIKTGVGFSAGLFLLFALIVVGISGDTTSPEAIAGLSGIMGNNITFFGSLFGFLTSSTIFLSIATSFRRSLWEDFKMQSAPGFFLLLLPPVIAFVLGVRNFINIIGLVGGVAVGIDMIVLLFMYAKAREDGNRVPEYSMRLPLWLVYAMMALFALGAIYTIIV